MAKIGRNDRCPCGSGKKYKHCCMARDQAAERERLAAERDPHAASLADPEARHDPRLCRACNEELETAVNVAFTQVDAGEFAEAEHTANEILARYPDLPDGYECLGQLHRVRGDNDQAVACYRQVIACARTEPYFYNAEFIDRFQNLIDQLEPRADAAD